VPEYVSVLYKEINEGFDFDAWSYGLLNENRFEKYDNFIFANSSIYGPFIEDPYESKWTDKYLNGLTNDIKIFGSTINTCRQYLTHSHLQSYIFAMKKETVKLLIDNKIFSINKEDNKEIKMSQVIINNGGNIGCLYKFYNGIDFRIKSNFPPEYDKLNSVFAGDIMYPHYNMNNVWSLNEVIFIKGNRFNI